MSIFLAILAIIVLIAGFAFRMPKVGGLVATALAMTATEIAFLVIVDAQQVGVVVSPSGVQDKPLTTGWHLVAPWNKVYFMDRTVWVLTCSNTTDDTKKEVKPEDAEKPWRSRELPASGAIWAPTKDGIKMGFDVSVSWRIDAEAAPWIYAHVTENDGGDSGRYRWLEENVIRTKLKSALALTVSNYTPIEAYSSKREEIQNEVQKRIKSELEAYKLILEQVDVREVHYNKEYENAINSKKLAEQEAMRLIEVTKQNEEQLKQARILKDIVIQQAEGEAQALRIKGSSIASNPKIIQLEWIKKWSGALPTTVMGNNAEGVILNMNK